ncbi:hypothetical protein PVNG_04261 [Plasmodium vivax North Korean]|uniref:Uncharacterized protein n=1 Tax=Plasmodium vivax North Korean TaxID=1035514 RepID=A0A0J9TSP3_PLAVI|nr:hypothetical protein PVNG_04261 [Plasmodium vivax North Korean]
MKKRRRGGSSINLYVCALPEDPLKASDLSKNWENAERRIGQCPTDITRKEDTGDELNWDFNGSADGALLFLGMTT